MCDVDFDSNLVLTLQCFVDIAQFVVACCPGDESPMTLVSRTTNSGMDGRSLKALELRPLIETAHGMLEYLGNPLKGRFVQNWD